MYRRQLPVIHFDFQNVPLILYSLILVRWWLLSQVWLWLKSTERGKYQSYLPASPSNPSTFLCPPWLSTRSSVCAVNATWSCTGESIQKGLRKELLESENLNMDTSFLELKVGLAWCESNYTCSRGMLVSALWSKSAIWVNRVVWHDDITHVQGSLAFHLCPFKVKLLFWCVIKIN